MANIFAREEKKFLLTKQQAELLKEYFDEYLKKDVFHQYKICNIYYDTRNFDMFRRSCEKPVYKEKLRLRTYGTPKLTDEAYLEVKKKYKGTVYKRRMQLPLQEAYCMIDDNMQREAEDINEKEIRYLLERYDVIPQVYLSYEREAYVWHDNKDFRITFDYDMKYRMEQVGLEHGDEGQQILEDDFVLMELKCSQNLPYEFVRLLNEWEIFPRSFSKIGYVYNHYIVPNMKQQYGEEYLEKLSQVAFA